MKKQPLCSIPELNQVFQFTMNNGETFKATGFNVGEAFESVKPADQWDKIKEWTLLDGETPDMSAYAIPATVKTIAPVKRNTSALIAQEEEIIEFEISDDEMEDEEAEFEVV
jgi:hypothetical protein